MPKPKPGQTLSQFAIEQAFFLGHFWSPDNPEGLNVRQADLKLLKPDDDVVVRAMISMSRGDTTRYTRAVLDNHGRQPTFDGVIGPAIAEMVIEGNRCPVPDHAPPPGVVFAFDDPDLQQVVERMQAQPAVGSGGNWAGCNGIGQFHCAAMQVNPAGMNPRVVPLWRQVMLNVRQMYAGIGLLWKFIDMDGVDLLTGEQFNGNIQTELSFVSRSDGWIGLAIVTRNEGCSSKIWLKLLNSYVGGSTDIQIINQISTLLAHEGGHNAGLSHSNGGVMNPSIVTGLPVGVWPENDPSTPILRTLYGGAPVPIPGGTPPGPTPDAPKTIEERMLAMEIKNIVNEVTLKWCVEKVKALGG